MPKLPFFRRAALRFLTWALSAPEKSSTHALNTLLYLRAVDGGRQAPDFFHPQIRVGEYTYGLRKECFFAYAPTDNVVIGKFCSIAAGVKFIFGNHRTDGVATYSFRGRIFPGEVHQDALSKGRIEIGNDVWIGANSTILSGVTIGDGSVIAAGSIVTKDIPPYSFVAGIPAVVKKPRLTPNQVDRLLEIQWWNWPIEKIKENEHLFQGSVDDFIAQHYPVTSHTDSL